MRAAPIEQIDLKGRVLASRFAVEQGLKDDGTPKIRAVDDETRAGINSRCQAAEKLQTQGVDLLFQVAKRFVCFSSSAPHV